jgi:hypothetical protein
LDAFKAATDMWYEALRERRNPTRNYFRIRDATGITILEVPFTEVLDGRQQPPARLNEHLADHVHTQIEVGQRILADQREHIQRMKADGSETTDSERTLDLFVQLLVNFEQALNWVKALRRLRI